MQAKYYAQFVLRPADSICADEYSGVVELSQSADAVLEPHEIEAILAHNFSVKAEAIELLDWARLH